MTAQLNDLRRDVEDFLFREARMLDEHQYEAWARLFTEDAQVWMPMTETREAGQAPDHRHGQWAMVEDDQGFLAKRIERLGGGLAHAEQPRSRTRRFITNVTVTPADDGSVAVDCNFIIFQSRRQTQEKFFVGSRRDRLVTDGDTYKIAERHVFLDHRVLPRAISFFF